ncbi:DNA replication protein [Lacticaseibacillus paracasei subsp. paracasei Lpp41]|uniref:DNA replication protein n=1 Tax=Lacticaseibacillus paracasei subsp. paracasei Lpp41 TaxID=1256208 RepID=A0A829H727_LACPA|nr:DNA replication protein [Lacticaseibacillus paracasei subsp. paracasei Lpp41]
MHVPTFVVEMKNAIGNNTVLPKIDRIKRAQVLILDDIGAESISPWVRDDVLGIILQYRMQEKMPTLFSSNKSMEDLTASLAGTDRGNSEMLKAKRIMERIHFLAKEVQVGGENRRNPLAD